MLRADSGDANKSLSRSGDWIGLGAGIVVGGGIAALPVPGTTVAGVAIAPLVTEAVGEAVNTFIGQEVDKGVDAREKDPTEEAQMTSENFYDKGFDQLGRAYDTYVKENPELGETGDEQNWAEGIKNSYDLGSGQDDYRGRAPYED
ncbi:hypothetical protein ABZS61_28820 [Streptomyces sp. NPDC005566]|uniref:hypothetical protein n=1 Tax=Streptomyces sp. NPDC005566 TaxID=3156886 RepID=UPI0033BDFAD4